MLGGLGGDRTVVRRLRLRGAAATRASGSHIARAVAAAALRPPTFPPEAILCVRRLIDPVPGRVCGPLALRPSPDWELAVRDRLSRLWHGAVRPALGAVPPNAESVLFANRAELLACLAADWRDGLLREHWWWDGDEIASTLGPGRSPVLRAWIDCADAVPAALACLAESRRIVPVVAGLADTEARAISVAVALRFALRSPDRPSLNVLEPPSEVARSERATDDRTASGTAADVAPSWLEWVGEANDPELGSEQRRLVVIGLLLHRAPAVIRDSCFMASFAAWNGTIDHRGTREPADGRSPGSLTDVAEADEMPGAHGTSGHQEGAEYVAPAEAVAVSESQRGDPMPHDASLGAGSPAIMPAAASSPQEGAVSTAFGGLFYLVNVALALDLYGDFTAPAHPGLDLSLWDLLALSGQDLAGNDFDSDPLATLLARLADRAPNERPGKRFNPGVDWRVPPAWLASFPERSGWAWSAARGRLIVYHPVGFIVADVPRDREITARSQLDGILTPLGIPVRSLTRRAHVRVNRRELPVDRWIGRLMPYVRARLRRALGSVDGASVGAFVCAHAARVNVSGSRVDVYLGLADLPIEVRLAGLDRNPGWVPSVGRIIAFHYE